MIYLKKIINLGVNMNCCDANGNCNQGRDCPIRKERLDKMTQEDKKNLHKKILIFGIPLLILYFLIIIYFL